MRASQGLQFIARVLHSACTAPSFDTFCLCAFLCSSHLTRTPSQRSAGTISRNNRTQYFFSLVPLYRHIFAISTSVSFSLKTNSNAETLLLGREPVRLLCFCGGTAGLPCVSVTSVLLLVSSVHCLSLPAVLFFSHPLFCVRSGNT